MRHKSDTKWIDAVSTMDFAFQPIVNIHTGACYGYEALLRGCENAGFPSIGSVFDHAFLEGRLHRVDLMLRIKAVEKFMNLSWHPRMKLFYNLDNRVFTAEDYRSGDTLKVLSRFNLSSENICFEISEKHRLEPTGRIFNILTRCRNQGYRIAVDDCGAGFSGFQMLYHTEPDYIKIDRFFIQDITNDPKKKLLVGSLVNIAHLMGSIVIAEGVESVEEFHSCRDIGCDLVQGYLVQRPQTDTGELKETYDSVTALSKEVKRRRKDRNDHHLVGSRMDMTPPLVNDCNILEVFGKFKSKSATFFPIVDRNNEPLGVIRESSLKEYAYSRFGMDLLQNPAFGRELRDFVSKYPIADLNDSIEKILEIYASNSGLEGIIIVDRMKYRGFLSTKSLLNVVNEKNLTIARDQNPLTKLPGNTLIYEYISKALEEKETDYVLIYFDFDNFKPFNDRYGFRNGDRLLLLFSELLKSRSCGSDHFAGHVGGDDFFLGIRGDALERTLPAVRELTRSFKKDAESFYDKEALEKGCIAARDREGNNRCFPLITVSSVIVALPSGRKRTYTTEEVSYLLGPLKSRAKKSAGKIALGGVDTETRELVPVSLPLREQGAPVVSMPEAIPLGA